MHYEDNEGLQSVRCQENNPKSGSNMAWNGNRKQTGNTECGYYMMRYMEEFSNSQVKTYLYPRSSQSSDPYSQQKLDDTRDRWTRFFIINMLMNQEVHMSLKRFFVI